MNDLLQKYNDYLRLKDCRAEYELSNGTKLIVPYREINFPHLLGLHKLKDIQLIQFWQDKSNKTVKLQTVLKRIENETFTDEMVKNSYFYPLIKTRYDNFSYDNLTTLNYTEAIINFNPTLINSKIKSDYILFEERPKNEYNHMGIALDAKSGTRYIETFFHQSTDMYIAGQKVVKVKKFILYDANNRIIVADSF
ncbi:MAG: hypothetical protein IKU39_08455 [Lachnospiraceae bacterium]|nr:hypothetical protein [Lachnospiraceae bacterium]